MLRNWKKQVFAAMLMAAGVCDANAGVEEYTRRIEGTALGPGKVLVVRDQRYIEMLSSSPSLWAFNNVNVEALIELGTDYYLLKQSNTSYAYDVKLKIVYQTWSGTAFVTAAPLYKTVHLNYNGAGATAYDDKNIVRVPGAHHIQVEIQSIKETAFPHAAVLSDAALPDMFYADVRIRAERQHKMELDEFPTVTGNTELDLDGVTGPEELEVNWGYFAGAEEYQLEYTWVSDYAGGSTGGVYDALPMDEIVFTQRDFELNCTRVVTSNQHYQIPLLYERGYLLYRLRGVSHGTSTTGDYDKTVYSRWSSDALGTLNTVDDYTGHRFYITKGHERNKNWQMKATFAEEGKRKDVVGYYDGTLRNRQNVTKINSDRNAIAGETIYDHVGRAGVNFLPVPTGDDAIKFYSAFNIENTSNEPYHFGHFDGDGSLCAAVVLPADSSSGAARYYSGNNAVAQSHKNFIARAVGYPFTVTQYEPDNTGRIRQQSGVGAAFAPGSGHETRYFYSQPYQEQLDRIFGSDVGNAQHYKKNAVVDANGQVSVSYMDMQGRTIATALAGNTNTHLLLLRDTLTGSTLIDSMSAELAVDLLNKNDTGDVDDGEDNNHLSATGDSLVYSGTHFVGSNATHHAFEYTLNNGVYEDTCIGGKCYPFVYNLDLAVRDACGNEMTALGINIHDTINKNYKTFLTTACDYDVDNYTIGTSHGFEADLNIGTYAISKKLSINDSALAFYANLYLQDVVGGPCYISQDSLASYEVSDVLDGTDCEVTCDECLADLGTLEDYIGEAEGLEAEALETAWHALYNDCIEPCTYTSLCEARYGQMLADVSPQGQYGSVSTGSGDYVVSVYNPDNQLPKNLITAGPTVKEYWQNPAETYKDVLNLNDSVTVIFNAGAGTYSPAVVNTGALEEQEDGSYKTPPTNLANLDDFVSRFKPSWAKALVAYHPEYPYFEWCDAADHTEQDTLGDVYTSEEYDSILNVTDTWDDAASLTVPQGSTSIGLTCVHNPTDCSDTLYHILENDPFFNDPAAYQLSFDYGSACISINGRQMMEDSMRLYLITATDTLRIEEVAMINARCGGYYGATTPTACLGAAAFGGDPTTEDAEWQQYVSMYLSLKQQVQQYLMDYSMVQHSYNDECSGTTYTSNVNGYCGCIGVENFWTGGVSNQEMPVAFTDHTVMTGRHSVPVITGWTTGSPVYMSNPGSVWGMYAPSPKPCSYYRAHLYEQKTRRFGLPPAGTAGDGGYSIFEATGLCPMAFDLGHLIENLGVNGSITDNNYPLDATPYFTTQMYTAFGGSTAVFDEYVWEASAASNVLSVEFTNGTYTACSTMTITGPTAFPWTSYPGGWSIEGMQSFTVTGSNTFTMKLWVDPDGTGPLTTNSLLTFTGSTPACLTLDGCDPFADVCMPNAAATDVVALLNALMLTDVDANSTADFYQGGSGTDISASSGGVDLYQEIFDQHLGWYLPPQTGGVNYYWDNVSSGVYHVYDQSTTVSDELVVSISPATGSSIVVFSNPVPTTSTGVFTVSGLNQSTGITSTYTITLELDTVNLPVGDCESPQPMSCSNAQVDNATHLLALLNSFVSSGTDHMDANNAGSGTNVLTGSPAWSNNMQNSLQSEDGAVLVADGVIDSDSFVIPITTAGEQDATSPTYYCTISLDAGVSGIDFTDITGFSGILADYSGPLTDGYPTQFTVTATTPGGSVTLAGTGCFALDNCVTVECGGDGIECNGTVQNAYYNLIDAINTSPVGYSHTYGAVTVDTSFAMAEVNNFCKPVQYSAGDEWIALQTAAEDKLGYYLLDMDLLTFAFAGYEACGEAYTRYLNNVYTGPGDYISLQDFCALNVDTNCVIAYEEYLDTVSTTPVSFTEYAQHCAPVQPCVNNPFENFLATPTDSLDPASACEAYLQNVAGANATALHESYLNSLLNNFITNYKKQALQDAVETFTMDYEEAEYHYTLYYYDQAGNLTRTVPPQGVTVLESNSDLDGDMLNDMEEIKNDRANNTHNYNIPHRYLTTYTYNSLNQLTKQHTPDAGTSYFWYDRLGRLVVSQNAKQAADSLYSYTRYDSLGRIEQVGQAEHWVAMTSAISRDDSDLKDWIDAATKDQVTHTVYDEALALTTSPMSSQENLRNRVAAVFYQETYTSKGDLDNPTAGTTNYEHATHYSYDVHGNVKKLVQEFPVMGTHATGQTFKTMEYDYDLISGKVNEFTYQPNGARDMWIHRYEYDADNRLRNVYTSTDGYNWDQEGKYFYYAHGPLSRTEYGQWKPQGTDYAYTLQGWIKGVNSDSLNLYNDMGRDGLNRTNNPDRYVGADAYGWSLGYFTNDYTSIGTSRFLADRSPATSLSTYGKNLYNGNISHMVTTLPTGTNVDSPDPQLGAYTYDQLNRIKRAQYYRGTDGFALGDNALSVGTYNNKYKEKYLYDGNGNILNLWRWDHTGTAMDNMNYQYYEAGGSTTRNALDASYYTNDMTNRLAFVNDSEGSGVSASDIDDQSSGNYGYDEIGQLIADAAEEIEEIEWTVKNKVRKVIRTNASTKEDLEFIYDAMGNRVAKIVKLDNSSVENGGTDLPDSWTYTYYALDASGNTVAVYNANDNDSVMLDEQMIYGSERLGTKHRNDLKMDNVSISTTDFAHRLGDNEYELKNHLGNVLVTISDMPRPKDDISSDNVTDVFEPTVMTASDYTPFGTYMTNRGTGSNGYRCGFNGMEKDDEMYNNSGASYDFGARMMNSRLGRWMSVDPFDEKYPGLTPYAFVANNPMLFIDPNGKEIVIKYGKEQRYTYGSKDPVPDDPFVKEAIKALDNLASSKSVTEQFGLLNTTKENIVVIRKSNVTIAHPNVNPIGGGEYVVGTEIDVDFNPTLGLEGKTDGKVLTPAGGLMHELGHVYNAISNPKDYVKRHAEKYEKGSENERWHNAEEKYNIQNNEHPYAKEHGQFIRDSHDGSDSNIIKTKGSTSTEKAVEETKPENNNEPIKNE